MSQNRAPAEVENLVFGLFVSDCTVPRFEYLASPGKLSRDDFATALQQPFERRQALTFLRLPAGKLSSVLARNV